MLFLHVNSPNDTLNETATTLDSVDLQLERREGRIPRSRDPQCCKHGAQGMCSHCQPLEPYDEDYRKSKGIKHLSFHAHLRKLGARPGSLEVPNYRVKEGCPRHAPYPGGICSLCQPPAISLNPQSFRFTDHVEFEQPSLVERFLAGWRGSGYQRFGWLMGRYDVYDEVPLGIKAVVCAIYEPPQDGSVDGFQLLENVKMEQVEDAAKLLGLCCVGMIYTDLQDDGTRTGKVECKRSADSFFLSSSEALFIAEQQQKHPNPCRYATSGQYGSKFVTVVATGDESNNVGLFAYQVSLTAMSLLAADLVSATTDPSLMMVNSNAQYVPDVFYKYRNEYGSQVQAQAKPTFPVDYLIVSLTHGFPRQSNPLFPAVNQFVPTDPLAKYLLPLPSNDEASLKLLGNFSLFLHLSTILSAGTIRLLATAITEKNVAVLREFLNAADWNALLSTGTNASTLGDRTRPISIDDEMEWTCPHCTFINTSTRDTCDVCGLPPMG
ncbi:Nuclear protein localization protein [Paramicrosporidium saccamoebae]|uniref:Nuclear protein localization protein 4 n=1 Tax=Paramicrosporidium saccamoebae TaxID=1246581 RepID=A0A2H9TJ07_9FUNG|nr:Nuclear protein localization protein [Paramicrosporidium saccamoebae]